MNLPVHITLTGVDDHTSVDGMRTLSREFSIEWGILLSPKRQGNDRYPTLKRIDYLLDYSDEMSFAAHLCGQYSRDVVDWGYTDIDDLIRSRVKRIQINTKAEVNESKVTAYAKKVGATPILQCRRDFFPYSPGIDFLFDQSGGRGIEPTGWPDAKCGPFANFALRGFAGGLSPDNVARHLATISGVANRYWIDMETGVRENDRFSLEKCRAVCEAVYRNPAAGASA